MEEILSSYRILGVQPGASQKQIKKAYRDLVKTWHPDQFGKDPQKREEAEQKLRAINLAFERLQEIGSTFDLVAALRAAYAAAPQAEASGAASERRSPREPTAGVSRDLTEDDDTTNPSAPPYSEIASSAAGRAPAAWFRQARWRWSIALAIGVIATITIYFTGNTNPPVQRKPSAQRPGGIAQRTQPIDRSIAPTETSSQTVPAARTMAQSPSPANSIEATLDIPGPEFEPLATVPSNVNSAAPAASGTVEVKEVVPKDAASRDSAAAIAPSEPVDPQALADMDLQFRMAMRFAQGEGVAQDFAEAAKWYRRAAEAGHPGAQKSLAFLYASGKGVARDFGEAERWFKKAASQTGSDDPLATALLSVAKSEAQQAQERKLTDAAAKRTGSAEAQFAMAQRYASGDGVPRDLAEAAKWYQAAAEAGHGLAQKHLGYFYLSGKGVEKNRIEAEKWLRKAAAQGVPGADLTAAILGIAKERE